MSRANINLSRRLLRWYTVHGRRDLPWHLRPDPYGVWVSEVMLQQTQVATVIPYFERFIERFPRVAVLAASAIDEVLHLWSGLGYYARARNLHRAARLVVERHGGEVPRDIGHLMKLPGIGRSTAGAILAMTFGDRHPVLDGNVKRVLTRVHLVDGWPGSATVERGLWQLAQTYTPPARVREYTQAIMDLGATVCTRARPACERCPLGDVCAARAEGKTARYPSPRPRKPLPLKRARFLLARRSDGAVLLERRPPRGVWGGLWSFPELAAEEAPADWCEGAGLAVTTPAQTLDRVEHVFTHFRLTITPVLIHVGHTEDAVMESGVRLWYKADEPLRVGLAKPVQDLLARLQTSNEGVPR